jgi:FkbM family methyltransferase
MKRYHPTRNPLIRKVVLTMVKWFRPKVFITVHGYKLYLPKRDWSMLSLHLLLYGCYEKVESERIQRFLSEGDIVVDVGAHVGYHTCLMSQAVGEKGYVYAFEPASDNMSVLKQNIQINNLTNVELNEVALGDVAGLTSIYLNQEDFGCHSLVGDGNRQLTQEITVARFDEVVPHKPIALVKIDVEGFELSVLRGMEGHLKQGEVRTILVEYTPYTIVQNGQSPHDFFSIIEEYGLIGEVLYNTVDIQSISLAQVKDNLAEYSQDHWARFNILLYSKGGDSQ